MKSRNEEQMHSLIAIYNLIYNLYITMPAARSTNASISVSTTTEYHPVN